MPRDLDCAQFRGDGFSLREESYAAGAAPVPALRSIPDRAPSATVVLLRGGPYRGVLRGVAASPLTGHLLARYGKTVILTIPAYLGTDPLRYGPGGLRDAEAEIGAVLSAESESGRPVCVIAASLGAFAAAGLVAAHRSARFLLVSPLASSPEDFVARARRAGVSAPKRRLTQLGSGGARQVAIAEDEAFLDYFGDAGRHRLADRLAPAARLGNWHILYSKEDLAIGQAAAAGLGDELGADRVTAVTGAGHAFEDPFNFPAYLPGIDAFLQRCLASA